MSYKLKLLSALSFMAAVISGCASAPQTVANWQYNPKISQAKNIANMFELYEIQDQKAPKGMGQGTFASNIIFNTSAIDAAYGSPFLPGIDGLGALGFGLLLSVGQAMKKEFWEVDNIFGFVPVKAANTSEKASEYLGKAIEKSIVQAVNAKFPEYKVETFDKLAEWRDPNKSSWDLPSYARIIHLVNPKDGCYSAKDYNEHKNGMCYITINVPLPAEQIALPPAIGSTGEQVWRITQKGLFKEDHLWAVKFYKGSDVENMLPSYKLLPQAAKFMPKNTYIYIASDIIDGKRTPPMILEGNKVHFFVKPSN